MDGDVLRKGTGGHFQIRWRCLEGGLEIIRRGKQKVFGKRGKKVEGDLWKE